MPRYLDIRGTTQNPFQIAIAGINLQSSVNRLLVRNAANNGFEAIAASSLLIGAGGDKRVSIQQAAPAPAVGDLWYELNADGALIYGFPWRWNGTYWLSPVETWDISNGQNAITATSEFYLPINPNLNYFLIDYFATTFSSVAQNGTNFWRLAIARYTGATSTTINNGVTTTGAAANQYVRSSVTAINTHVNTASTSATVFAFQILSNGTPGNLFIGGSLTYCFARP